jgi:hypothetical protein
VDDVTRDRVRTALKAFWGVRAAQQANAQRLQGGSRSSVTGGQHLNEVRDLIAEEFVLAGFPESSVQRTGRAKTLPGYFRPTKNWDLAVVHGIDVAALVELKSQVGSIGNNANNRAEESIGNAVDADTAFSKGLLGERRPWLCYIYVIEDSPAATASASRDTATIYERDPAFRAASYMTRLCVLGQRLVSEGLYDAAWVVATSKPESPLGFTWREPNSDIGYERLRDSIRTLAESRGYTRPVQPPTLMP